MSLAGAGPGQTRSSRFAGQLAWNGVAFLASLVSGFVLSPLVIRGVGIEAYGVWALVFSILEYLAIADLGIRAATVKYVAHYLTLGDREQLYRTLNASCYYFLAIATPVAAIMVVAAGPSVAIFSIPLALRNDYVTLIRLVGITMAFQLLFNVAKAALEGAQDFVTLSRINVIVNLIRTSMSLAILHYGFGVVGLGWAMAVATWIGFVLLGWSFRRRFPGFLPSRRNFDRAVFKQLLQYGLPALLGTIASHILHFGPILILGIVKDAASVGYFSLVLRLLSGIYEIISQTGSVTSSAVAQLAAQEDHSAVERTVLYLNRYSFALFCFPMAFLFVQGSVLFQLWVGPQVAAECLRLLPWLVGAYAFGAAAHQNSIGTLFGLGIHKSHNIGVAIEALVFLGGWFLFVPGRPLWFAAAWWSISFVLNRGLRPSWLVCRALNVSFLELLAGIYTRPLAITVATATLLLFWSHWAPPHSLVSLGAMATVVGIMHLIFCYAIVLAPEHRSLLAEVVRKKLRGRER